MNNDNLLLSYVHFRVNKVYINFVHDIIQTSCFFFGGKK